MDQEDSLQSILSDSQQAEVSTEVTGEKTPEVKVEEAKAADATATPVVKEPEKAQEEKKPLSSADIAAIVDERRKRQAAERRAQEAEEKLAKAAPTEKPDFWTDPEKAMSDRVESAVKPIKERFFRMSVESAASKHSDFNDAVEAFDKLISANPALHREWLESEDPGEFIYQVATNTPAHREKALTDLKGELSKRDERLAALEKELAEMKTAKTDLALVPKSLSKQSGANPSLEESDEDDTKTIVRFGNKSR